MGGDETFLFERTYRCVIGATIEMLDLRLVFDLSGGGWHRTSASHGISICDGHFFGHNMPSSGVCRV